MPCLRSGGLNLLPLPAIAASRQRQVDGVGNLGRVNVVVVRLMQPLGRRLLALGVAVRSRAGGGQAGDEADEHLETHVCCCCCSFRQMRALQEKRGTGMSFLYYEGRAVSIVSKVCFGKSAYGPFLK